MNFKSSAKKYRFNKKKKWTNEFTSSVIDFSKTFFLMPNIVYLNSKTAKLMGLFPIFKKSNQGKIIGSELITINISGKETLEVILDESLKDRVYVLSYYSKLKAA